MPSELTPNDVWFFCDNEGCLVAGKGLAFDLSGLKRIRRFLADEPNVRFSLATGRAVPYVEAITQVLGLSGASYPSVCEAGAVLYWPADDTWQLVGESFIDKALIERIPREQYRLELGKVGCLTLYPNSPATIQSLYELVLASPLAADYTIRTSSAAVDITPRGVDKGAGLTAACKTIGFPLERTIAIGDSDNDLPILMAAGFAAAPSNATPEVKAQAHYVSPYEATEGVLDILEQYAWGRLSRRPG